MDVMTYNDSSSGHMVAPVSAESAQAAFNDACGDSLQRREDVAHPGMHVGKSGNDSAVLLLHLDLPLSIRHDTTHYAVRTQH